MKVANYLDFPVPSREFPLDVQISYILFLHFMRRILEDLFTILCCNPTLIEIIHHFMFTTLR